MALAHLHLHVIGHAGTLLAYYFRVTYGVSATFLGGLLFIANVVAGISSVSSG